MVFYQSNKFIFLLILTILSFYACKSIKPQKPTESYIDTTYHKQLSWVNIPIRIPLAEIEKQLNTQVKGLLYTDSILDDDNIELKVWKKDKISISTNGDNNFYFTIPLKVWAMTGFEAESFGIDLSQYKQFFFEINLKFKSAIQITKDWRVAAVTTPDGYDWITKPKVMIGPFEVPITPVLNYLLKTQLPELAQELDQQIQHQLTIKTYVDQVWTIIQQPFELSKTYTTWLQITPDAIMMTPIQADARHIVSFIGVKGYVESVVGQKPVERPIQKLPNLELVNAVQDYFQIAMIGEISHAYSKKLLEENFIDKSYSFKDGKYNITIKAIDLYGSNNLLVLKLSIIGSARGDIYLKGKPYFDEQTSTIRISQLDYDIKTRNALLKAADWLNHGNFIKSVQKNLVFDVSKELEDIKRAIRESLNSNRIEKNILLNGSLDRLTPGDVFITPQSIKAIVFAEGKLQLTIDGF